MAAGQFTLYNSGRLDISEGDWEDDDHYAILLDASYSPDAAHDTLSDVSGDEIADEDYERQDLTGESTTLDGTDVVHDADDVAFGDPVDIEAKYIVVVQGTVTGSAAGDRLVGYMDLNTDSGAATAKSVDGEFTVQWHEDGLFVLKDPA